MNANHLSKNVKENKEKYRKHLKISRQEYS